MLQKSALSVINCNRKAMDKRVFLMYYPCAQGNTTDNFCPAAERRFIYMKRFIDSNRWEIVSAALISGLFTASVIVAMTISSL